MNNTDNFEKNIDLFIRYSKQNNSRFSFIKRHWKVVIALLILITILGVVTLYFIK